MLYSFFSDTFQIFSLNPYRILTQPSVVRPLQRANSDSGRFIFLTVSSPSDF